MNEETGKPVDKTKAEWFHALPMVDFKREEDKYMRTCPCGSTILYNGDNLAVRSWINIHFGHEPERLLKAKPFAYEGHIAWRFSYLGFFELIKVFQLKEIVHQNPKVIVLENKRKERFFFVYTNEPLWDKNYPEENIYVFYLTHESDNKEIRS